MDPVLDLFYAFSFLDSLPLKQHPHPISHIYNSRFPPLSDSWIYVYTPSIYATTIFTSIYISCNLRRRRHHLYPIPCSTAPALKQAKTPPTPPPSPPHPEKEPPPTHSQT